MPHPVYMYKLWAFVSLERLSLCYW